MPGGRPRVALLVVWCASHLLPRTDRRAWRAEWEAELLGRWHERSGGSRVRRHAAGWDLFRRSLGSVVDAFHCGYGRWTMDGWLQEVAIATRGLLRRPGFSAVVVLTLAVGIGANTAIYGVARDVLLRPFPYPDPERVVAIEDFPEDGSGFSGNSSYPNLADLEAAATTFEAIGALRIWGPALEDDRGSFVTRGATVTADFFRILGVQPELGRFFRPDEEGEGRAPTVVLSHVLWTDRYGSDPGIVGSTLSISGTAYEVIGVTPSDFEDPWLMDGPGAQPMLWRTVSSPPSEWPRGGRSWRGIGRVRPGVSVEVAGAELSSIFDGLEAAYPESNAARGIRVTPLRELVAGPSEPMLYTLLGAVGLLLLVACANLANLMLGRALDRRGEMALHRALGAPGWRIVHRGLAEAGILAAVGGLGGIGLAVWLGRIADGLDSMLPRPVDGAVDGGVLAFALLATGVSGMLFGLAPAVQGARSGGALPGQDESRGSTAGVHGNRLRRTLVVGELALTLALLVGSGLLLRSFQRLGAVDLGLDTAGVVAVPLHGGAWSGLEPPEARAQWEAVLDAVRSVPGVDVAGAIDVVPLGGGYSCDGFARSDLPPPEPGEGRCAEVRAVLPGAMEAMRVPLVRGRMVSPDDGADAPAVVVIDETAAEAFWPGEDPIGARVVVHGKEHEVVGVVGGMRHFGPAGEVRPSVYLSAPQEGWNGVLRGFTLLVRGDDPSALVPAIRDAVSSVNGAIAIGDVRMLAEMYRATTAPWRFRTVLMAAFALTAVLLAVLGIAGVMMYSVSRRTRELGVRLALGAAPGQVLQLVLREGTRLVAAGVVLGLVGALSVAGVLERVLFEVSARDPWVYGLVTVLLAGVAIAACYLPARRASRVDPIAALGAD